MSSILIVNSHADFLAILTAIFTSAGYHVIATTNSLITLDLFNKYKPCAVIIDIYMAEKDGFEVTKEIRAVSKKVFILVISSRNEHLNIITYLGADLVLPISANPELIVNAVAVAEKEQLFLKKFCSLSHQYQRKKSLLKLA